MEEEVQEVRVDVTGLKERVDKLEDRQREMDELSRRLSEALDRDEASVSGSSRRIGAAS